MSFSLSRWPEIPVPPRQGEVAVIRILSAFPRAELSVVARDAVRDILRAWGHAAAKLVETTTGPKLLGCGEMALSLAYTRHCAWIALTPGRSVGIDATPAEECSDWREVARTYLGPAAVDLAAEPDPAWAFAAAWSRHEATLKYHRLPLTEWHPHQPQAPRHVTVREADVALSVVLDA